MLEKTAAIVDRVASGIRAGQFIATPDYYRACRYCAFASICPYTATGDPEWLEEQRMLKLLHLADVHLGKPFQMLGAQGAAPRPAPEKTFVRAVDPAIAKQVHV